MQEADRINRKSSAARAIRVESLGHVVFAVTIIGLGVLGLIKRDFPPTWGGVPKGMPAREVLVYLCAVVSLVTGVGLILQLSAAIASRVLLTYLLIWLLLFRVSHLFFAPGVEATWWACGDTAVMAAAAWVLYAWFNRERDGSRATFAAADKDLRVARMLYGLGLIPFGVAHFTYLKESVAAVPGWLPWHVFWAYFTGCTFIAAGVAVLIGVYARLAAALSALQLGLFTLLVWLPVVIAGPNAFQWSEFVDSCALTAGAWVVADSYRGMPWLAIGRRCAADK